MRSLGSVDLTLQLDNKNLLGTRQQNLKKEENNSSSIPSAEETEAQSDELTSEKMQNVLQVNALGRNSQNQDDVSPNTAQKISDTIFEDQVSTTATTTINKKSNFSVVCMLPSKQPRATATVSQSQKDRNHTIIEKQTLQHILQLQQQYRESRENGPNSSIGNQSNQNQNNNGSQLQSMTSSLQLSHQFSSSAYNSQYSNSGNFQNNSSPSKPNHHQQQQQQQNKYQGLNIDKIGLCGIPSLWLQREELIKEKHLNNEAIQERERIDKILRILQIHKKYENEKYFGGTGIYKRGQVSYQTGIITGGQGGSSFINQDYIQFSTEILISKQKGQNRDEKINSIVKDESQQKEPLPSNEGTNSNINQQNTQVSQAQVFPHIRNYDNPEQLLFKVLYVDAKLIRMILESHGFLHTESNDWNILWTATSTQQKSFMYENLNENQKINHFVNSSEITRKDRLCYNVGKMQMKFGRNNFNFLPETYILPDEFSEFYKSFMQYQSNNDEEKVNNLWIIKPTASSQGKGIFMINELAEVPINEPLVISKYIGNPLLINGLKFDLRLYVLVTSFDPLKIYIYNEGLVRFASEPYDLSNSKQNVYAHLTNYSINKKSEYFIQNKNISQRDFGNKWSLSALQTHLQNLGIDMKIVWERIYDSIIKSLLSIEHHVSSALKKIQNVNNTQNKSNSFDLFGFDIILDKDLKPWILEVNLSPSLAFDSPLDFHIKSNLVVDTFNIVGIKKFTRRKDFMGKQVKVQSNDQKKRYQSALNVSQQNGQTGNQTLNKTDTSGLAQNINKQNQIIDQAFQKNQFEGIDIGLVEKLSKISAKHRELLREHLEEFARNRKQNFTRIYPVPGSHTYDIYFEQPRPLNKLLFKYLYQQNDLQDIINLIAKSQNKSQNQVIQEPYSDNFLLNHTSSTNSIQKQDKGNSQANQSNQNEYSQKPQSSHHQFDQEINKNRSSSISSIKNQLYSPKNDYQSVSHKQNDEKLSDKSSENYPTMSPLQRKKYEEKRSVTSNKKKDDDGDQLQNKLNLNSLINHASSKSSATNSLNQNNTTNPQNAATQQAEDLIKSKDSTISKDNDEKVIITGDDILIEYVRRVMQTVKIYQTDITSSSTKKLEQFLNHKVWYSKNQQNRQAESQSLWQRIETKFIEMQERKRRLFIKKMQQEGVTTNQSDKFFMQNEKQKEDIIKDFTSNELEQMLIQSNKNNQIEVVSILLCGQNSIVNGMSYTSGILTKIEKECQRLSKNSSQMLKLMKICVDQSQITNIQDSSSSSYNTNNDNFYGSPKDSAGVDKSQILTRMKTSDDKIHQSNQSQQYHPFNYKTQQSTYDQFHSSYSHQKSNTYGQNSVLYQSTQAQSKQNLLQHKSGKKSNHAAERDFMNKESEKKITLPQINNNHLSQDYSRVSIQLNNGLGSNINQNNNNNNNNNNNIIVAAQHAPPLNQDELHSKYRTRLSNEKFFIKQIRQQSLQSEKSGNKQSSLKIARNQANTKFERIEI